MAINVTTAAVGRRAKAQTGGPFSGLRRVYADWQERARIRDELMMMSSRELADLGLSPSDIEEVAAGTYRRD